MSEKWFEDVNPNGAKTGFVIEETLLEKQTPFQKLGIYRTKMSGLMLGLDDTVQLTERDEPVYHEMMAHVPLLAHPAPERVLVIGGGDGGVLREVIKHPEVKSAHLCEIDADVINISKSHLKFTACGFDDPRVEVHVADGIKFLQDNSASFDVIMTDSTDPVGMAAGFIREDFYRDVVRALKPGGIFVQQTDTPFWNPETVRVTYKALHNVFANVHMYLAFIPMYPSGGWSLAFASPSRDPWAAFDPARAARLTGLRYYVPEMQRSAFVLPVHVRELATREG